MLVLTRQREESVMVGDDVEVTVVDIRGDKVRLGFDAPPSVSIYRKEVHKAIRDAHHRDQRSAAPESARPRDAAAQLAELTAVAGGLAHEIRNPLSTLRVNLQLLAEDLRDIAGGKPRDLAGVAEAGRKAEHRARTMLREVDRLAQTIDDYVGYVGKEEPAQVLADIRDVVAELAEFFEPQAARSSIALRVERPDAPLNCRTDPNALKQALLNLLINAQQAMPSGGVLTIRMARAGSSAKIEVIDTGPGIPPEILPRIFEPYFSARPGGTGMGLATARRVISRQGGTLEVETGPSGSRFTIKLPIAG